MRKLLIEEGAYSPKYFTIFVCLYVWFCYEFAKVFLTCNFTPFTFQWNPMYSTLKITCHYIQMYQKSTFHMSCIKTDCQKITTAFKLTQSIYS